jgi:peptidoglycan hydrolase FlgJ
MRIPEFTGREVTPESTSRTAAAPRQAPDSPEESKLKKAVGDFEAILVATLWKGMKQSFGSSESDSSDPAHGSLDDWGIEVMSEAVGRAGGLGIGKLILKQLEPTLKKETLPAGHGAALGKEPEQERL